MFKVKLEDSIIILGNSGPGKSYICNILIGEVWIEIRD
jgi:ABC-type taurine transport system ATPase subunit